MPVIETLLQATTHSLKSVTDTPRLEAEILLAFVLNMSRTHLHAWPEKEIEAEQYEKFLTLIQRRLQKEPIAYLIGTKEFWSLDLIVTPDVLIPRPETELLVECVLETIKTEDAIIADLGTGSGAIALALAHERPHWKIHATDQSPAALEIAKLNAKRLKLSNVSFHQGSWCEALPNLGFDAIVSNPPYIPEEDPHLNELKFEPSTALIAGKDGLSDLQQIIIQAKNHLNFQGFLFLEHGWNQAENLVNILQKEGYTFTVTHQDLAKVDRVTIASRMRF